MKFQTKPVITVMVIIAALSLFLQSCCAGEARIIDEKKFLMGTIVEIKVSLYNGTNEKKAREAIAKAFDEIKRIEDIFTVYNEASEISRINKLRKNEKLQISHEAFTLIKRCLAYSAKTDGAFDITVKPLVELWKKAKKTNTAPGEEAVKHALERTGYGNVVLDEAAETIFFKKNGMGLDLGGAAKGYAAGRAVRVLQDNGVRNALVSSGGDMYCMGKKSRKELWKAGVRHPRDKNKIFMEIKLQNISIDTSGDYERYFTLNGRRYSHIIDPRTGYPTGDGCVSSTVITQDPVVADIMATALSVLGQKGLVIAQSMKGVDAVIVYKYKDEFIVKMTDGINKRYEIIEKNF